MPDSAEQDRWKHDGVRVIAAGQLDPNTAQTPGMDRKAAINFAVFGETPPASVTPSDHTRPPTTCQIVKVRVGTFRVPASGFRSVRTTGMNRARKMAFGWP